MGNIRSKRYSWAAKKRKIVVSPEFSLLTACVCRPMRQGVLEERLQSQSFDWNHLIALANRHRVAGLVCDALLNDAHTHHGVMPPTLTNWLRTAQSHAVVAEMKMLWVLKEVLARLHKVGFDPVLLKGLHLSRRAFGRMGVRSNRDIDLLVNEEEFFAVVAVLAEMGFYQLIPDPTTSSGDMMKWLRRRKDASYVHGDTGIVVELHWRFFDNPYLAPIQEILETRREEIFADVEARVLTPRANLAYLAAHGGEHAWSRLKWIADFHALIVREGAEAVSEAKDYAHRAGVGPSFKHALLLTHYLFGACSNLDGIEQPRGVRSRLMRSLAMISLAQWGEAEIENIWGGTKARNAGHYLLSGRISYLFQEFLYDLSGRFPKRQTSPARRAKAVEFR